MSAADDLAADVADALVTLMGEDRSGLVDAEPELDVSAQPERAYVAVQTLRGPWCLEVHQGDTLPAPPTPQGSVAYQRPPKGTPEYAVWLAAIDVALAAPLKAGTNVYAASIPWSIVNDLRAQLTAAGIDWRAQHKAVKP